MLAAIKQDRRPTGRPPKVAPQHWREVAQVYLENNKGADSVPTKAVAEHFQVTPSTAAKWVSRARRMYGHQMGAAPLAGRPRNEPPEGGKA